MSVTPPPNPLPRLAIGVTGHRDSNPGLAANRAAVTAAVIDLFGKLEAQVRASDSAATSHAPTRLHNLLVSGVDIIAAEAATTLGWELVAPLPFGEALNIAVSQRKNLGLGGPLANLLRAGAHIGIGRVLARQQRIGIGQRAGQRVDRDVEGFAKR